MLPCPSPSPGACSNSCPLSRWCHPAISSCHTLLLPSIFPSILVLSNESALHIRCPKYWSFRFSISSSMNIQDWFSLGLIGLISLLSNESLLQHHSLKASIIWCSAFFWRRKWQPTPVFLPGKSQGWGSLVDCCLWGRTESDTTEVT